MTIAASVIVTRLRNMLIDTGANSAPQRWSDAELLSYISDGQRAIITAIPRASAKRAVVNLVTGTRQAIPADGYSFMTAYRNMGAGGATPGNAVMVFRATIMDTQLPTWHSDAAKASAAICMYDLSDKEAFYVYPPNDGTGTLEINYSQTAVELAALSDTLTVKDIYLTPLFDYGMFRAHQKDSDYAAGMTVAKSYFDVFMAFLQAGFSDAITNKTLEGQT